MRRCFGLLHTYIHTYIHTTAIQEQLFAVSFSSDCSNRDLRYMLTTRKFINGFPIIIQI